MTKTLIIFYSLEWFTRTIAQDIAHQTKGKLLELHPSKDICKGFVKYFWGGKQVLMKETPKLKKYTINFEQYTTIYIGTPVWAFTYTPAIRSFLQQTPIQDKNIILFCTHEWRPKHTLQDMEDALPGNTIIAKKAFHRKLLEHNEPLRKQEVAEISNFTL